MNFVVANYELLNGLSRGLTIVCNLMILLKKQLRKRKNVRYFFTITTICYKYTFVESLQVR